MRSFFRRVAILAIVSLLIWFWQAGPRNSPRQEIVSSPQTVGTPRQDFGSAPSRILFVHSYHKGYPWTDGILAGFIQALGFSQQQESDFWGNTEFVLQNFYMDTKRKPAEDQKRAAAAHAQKIIESWQPDIVVTSDDNAVKYLVVPMISQSPLPFVFCGVNWSANEYSLPPARVTGMIEVQPVDQILETLQPFARGTRIGFLKGEDFSAAKEADAFEIFLGLTLQRRLVANFEEWLVAYRELQQDCDILLVGNSASIQDWDSARARQHIAEETRIPSGTWDAWMREYALVTFSTVPEEQGAWAAETVRTILAGTSPDDIPMSRNQKAKIYRNMELAKGLEIVFPMEFIRRSWAVEPMMTE